MKQLLNVNINSEKEYSIEISDNSFDVFIKELNDITQGHKRLVVISKKVYKLYKDIFNFKEDEIYILKDGEKEKNYKNYLKILKTIVNLRLTRQDYIIAMGGGVVGDLAGFVASTYMRGINYIQVPTTLLSMVDSSVGGKTAIDFCGIKNNVGTFYQPKAVFINIRFLETLDKKQFMSGLGEVLKYAFIEKSCGYEKDLYLFEYLALGNEKILQKEPVTLIRVIDYCLKLKIAVVNKDEQEAGLRRILNFGHTIGHALEAISNYRKYTHGAAVVQGMFIMIKWAYKQEYISESVYKFSIELLEKYGFLYEKIKYSKNDLIEIMKLDKKATTDKITFIVPVAKKIVEEVSVEPSEISEMLVF